MDLAALERQLADYARENRIFGMLRVTQNDAIRFQTSFGWADIASQTPFTDASMFSFYSLSKPFCAIGLLKLCDLGLVSPDAHPGVYVPEARGFDPRVTLRQMLHHTSGLPDFEQIPEFAAAHRPGYARFAREQLRELAAYPQFFEPGTAAKYENINFLLCALVIENVSGLPYTEYMRREVFGPLGMRTAVIDDETLAIPRRAEGYDLSDGVLVPVGRSRDWMFGAGDIVGTVDDAYALHRAVRDRLLLAPGTWEQVLTPSPLNGMGMGCTLSVWHGFRRITHNGGHTGFRTLHIHVPERDFDLILLSNTGFGNARADLSEMVWEALYPEGGASDAVPMDAGYIPRV